MGVLDARLEPLLLLTEEIPSMTREEREWYGIVEDENLLTAPRVAVLLQVDGDLEPLLQTGFVAYFAESGFSAGSVEVARLRELAESPGVFYVEGTRPYYPELYESRAAVGVESVSTAPLGLTGRNIIVGIIDRGIDYAHPNLRKPDGTTRILAMWDQAATSGPDHPAIGEPFNIVGGVEYRVARINQALGVTSAPVIALRPHSSTAHGTMVAGICVSNGSAAAAIPGAPGASMVGLAPDADIIFVRSKDLNTSGVQPTGESLSVQFALKYIFDRAQAFGRPVVVNLSLGDNFGPHDGTSMVERYIDQRLVTAGCACVKSAGNERQLQHHTSTVLGPGVQAEIAFTVAAGGAKEEISLWHTGAITCAVEIENPGGELAGPVTNPSGGPPGPPTIFSDGNRAAIAAAARSPFNNDFEFLVTLDRLTAVEVTPGTWIMRIRNTHATEAGTLHGWAQQNGRVQFQGPLVNDDCTVTTPGTGRRVVTVGSSILRDVMHPELAGALTDAAPRSSQGWTRDGRVKPDIVAPGQGVASLRGDATTNIVNYGTYAQNRTTGTSAAAPHVAGIIALMFERDLQIRGGSWFAALFYEPLAAGHILPYLHTSARAPVAPNPYTGQPGLPAGLAPGALPSPAWGFGHVDAGGAVRAVKPIVTYRWFYEVVRKRFVGLRRFTPSL
jgi:subtilisin family serine protease